MIVMKHIDFIKLPLCNDCILERKYCLTCNLIISKFKNFKYCTFNNLANVSLETTTRLCLNNDRIALICSKKCKQIYLIKQ